MKGGRMRAVYKKTGWQRSLGGAAHNNDDVPFF